MGQLTPLIAGKLVALDTGPLIYYIEEHPGYLSTADELFSTLDNGTARGMTSVLTLPGSVGQASPRGPGRTCREIPTGADEFGECNFA